MGTISSAFNIIRGALDADQSALSIVAGNVANASTPGYTRELPSWQENPPVTLNGRTYGNGVTALGATSVRDRILLQRLNQQQQLASASGVRLQALTNLESLFPVNSGSSGSSAGDIGSDLTNFFNSFSSLEANPSNNALRQQVLSTARVLAADVSGTAASIQMQRAALDQQAGAAATQANALLGSIAQLNTQIQSLSPGQDAGTLEDERQLDLAKLSQLMGINQVKTENNGLTITTASGRTIIAHGNVTPITSSTLNGVTHFFLAGTDVTGELTSGGGQLGGLLTARDQDLPNTLSRLDQLAYGVTAAVNAQNAAGSDLNGNAGAAIFTPQAQVAGSALGMSVQMTDPNLIAAAAAGQGTGDNANAVALAALASQAIALLGGHNPSAYYAGFVTELGSTVAQVRTENTAENASVSQLQSQSNALSQVNLNDEAAAMSTLERSYQAASQVFGILNTIMATAVNLGQQTAAS